MKYGFIMLIVLSAIILLMLSVFFQRLHWPGVRVMELASAILAIGGLILWMSGKARNDQ